MYDQGGPARSNLGREAYQRAGQDPNASISRYQYSNLEVIGQGTGPDKSKILDNTYFFDDADRVPTVFNPAMAASRSMSITLMASVSGVLILIASILLWVIYSRSEIRFWLWTALACLLFSVLSFLVAIMGLATRKNILSGIHENLFISTLGFVLTSVMAGLVLAMALLTLFMRYTRFNELMHQATLPGDQQNMAVSFQSTWWQEKTMIGCSVFFEIITGLILLLSAVQIWTITGYPIQLARALLSTASGISLIFFAFALNSLHKAKASVVGLISTDAVYSEQDYTISFWLSVVVAGLLLVSLIISLTKKKFGYFALFFLLLVLGGALIIQSAVSMRPFRKNMGPGEEVTLSAVEDLKTFHEDDIKPACDKYASGSMKGCGKGFDTKYFEGDNGRKTLSPTCARKAQVYVFRVLHNGLALIFLATTMALLVSVSSYLLSDTSEFMETNFTKQSTILEYVGFICLGAAVLIYLVALIFAEHSRFREQQQGTSDIEQKLRIGLVKEPDYIVVPEKLHQQKSSVETMCSAYNFETMASVGHKPKCSSGGKCGYRVFVLAESSEIVSVLADVKGDPRMRFVKYSQALNSLDGFVFFRGDAATVNQTLANMRFCQRRYNKQNGVFVIIEPVNLNELTESGQFPIEDPVTVQLEEVAPNGFPSGFSSGVNKTCIGNETCNFHFLLDANNKKQTVVGQFFAKKQEGSFTKITREIKESLRVEFFHGLTSYITFNSSQIADSGYFSVKVPASVNTPYELTMVVTDDKNRLVSMRRGLLVSSNDGGQVVAGNLPLIHPSGKGCADALDFDRCADDQLNSQKGKITVMVYSADDNRPMQGIKLKVTSQQTYKEPVEHMERVAESSKNGAVVFDRLDLGYYTVRSLTDKFKKSIEFFTLDEKEVTISLYLVPEVPSAMNINLRIENLKNADTDLRVKIVNHNDRECIVSSFSKYCAFALYLFDVGRGSSGMESIRIHNLTVSHYMVYTHTAFNLDQGKCDHLEVANSHFMETKSLNWHQIENHSSHQLGVSEGNSASQGGKVDTSKPFWIGYCFTGFGEQSLKTVNQLSVSEPSASRCTDLYPDKDEHSLSKLRSALATLN